MVYDIIVGAALVGLILVVIEYGIPFYAKLAVLAEEQQKIIIELGRLKLKIEKEEISE